MGIFYAVSEICQWILPLLTGSIQMGGLKSMEIGQGMEIGKGALEAGRM